MVEWKDVFATVILMWTLLCVTPCLLQANVWVKGTLRISAIKRCRRDEIPKKETEVSYVGIYFLIKEHFIYMHLLYKSHYISADRNEYFTNKKTMYVTSLSYALFHTLLSFFLDFISFESNSEGCLMVAAV